MTRTVELRLTIGASTLARVRAEADAIGVSAALLIERYLYEGVAADEYRRSRGDPRRRAQCLAPRIRP